MGLFPRLFSDSSDGVFNVLIERDTTMGVPNYSLIILCTCLTASLCTAQCGADAGNRLGPALRLIFIGLFRK